MSDYISDDDLVLIFRLFPVKSLLRFRSVSKWWKQLIDSPAFVKDHLTIQKPLFIIDLGHKYTVVDPRPLPIIHTMRKPIAKKKSILVGTLCGVVCVYEIDRDFVIWNPSIHKFSIVPSGFKWGYWRVRYSFGFWIDPSTKEFKIIVLQGRRKDGLRNHQSKTVADCILYSLIRGDWSVIASEKLRNLKFCTKGPPVFVGGVAHWRGCLEDFVEDSHEDKVVLSFDFAQERQAAGCDELLDCALSLARHTFTFVLDVHYPYECMIYLRQEDSWVKMLSFQFYDHVMYIFWATEDMEIRAENRKRKRGIEDSVNDLSGVAEGHVRVLATTAARGMLFDGTKSGTKIVRRGLVLRSKVNVAYDFVESLLFPQ